MMPKPYVALVLAAVLATPYLTADEIKLKSGDTISGRIVFESDDIVRIEVAVTASIKETKTLSRGDIESIAKDAPDDVAFNKIQGLLPTSSLLPVDEYRRLLEGPNAFLRDYPDSKHAEKVKEIRDTLAEELDKVERGFVKVEEDWYSPHDKLAYKDLIDSRIRFVRMQGFAKGNNIASYIAAMREFEQIEKNYLGSPAYPKAIELAREVVTNFGRQLTTLEANVDHQNAEYKRSFDASLPDIQAQLKAARDREDKAIADSIAADKKTGIKWTQLNPRSKPAIQEYLKFAAAELTRLRELDTAALAAQAEQLVQVDRLIAEDKVAEAKTKLTAAMAMPTNAASSTGSASKSKSSSQSKSKGSAKSGSYIAVLNAKIEEKLALAREEEKRRKASEALAAKLKPSSKDSSDEEGEEGAGEETDEEKTEAKETDGFAALAAPSKKGSTEEADSKKKGPAKKGDSKQSSSKAKSSSKSNAEDEDAEDTPKRRPAPVEEEGGFPFWMIGVGISLLVVIVAVVMKVLGLGGKKDDDE